MKNRSVDMKTVCVLIYVKLTVGYLSSTHVYIYIYTLELAVKPTFLWLLLETEVLRTGRFH